MIPGMILFIQIDRRFIINKYMQEITIRNIMEEQNHGSNEILVAINEININYLYIVGPSFVTFPSGILNINVVCLFNSLKQSIDPFNFELTKL